MINESIAIQDDVAVEMFKMLNRDYNADVGITTGMAYAAALNYCENTEGETIVIISSDGGGLYGAYM
jgi:cysteine synthase